MSFAARILLVCFLFGHSISVQAITPIDTLSDPEQGFSGTAGLGLSGKSGSKDESEYSISLLGRHVEDERTALLISNYNYGESNDVKDEDDLFVHFRWIQNNFFRESLDWENFLQYEYDKFDDLNSRKLIGSGVRMRFTRESESGVLNTSFGAGGFFEEEVSESSGATEQNWRGNFYGKWVWNRKGNFPFQLYGQIYLQPVLDDLGDLRSTANAGIKFGLSEAIALHLDAEIEHDSEPFEEAEKTNFEYGVKLSYSF